MNEAIAEESQSGCRYLSHPNVRVSVKFFGPIKNGSVDVRPLSVFVGPSNTGKTYLATLIYAFHNATNGLFRFPVSESYQNFINDDISVFNVEIQRLADILNDDENSLLFSGLPERIRMSVKDVLVDKSRFARSLKLELERCFDLDRASDLIHAPRKSNGARLSFSVGMDDIEYWNFEMKISKSSISSREA